MNEERIGNVGFTDFIYLMQVSTLLTKAQWCWQEGGKVIDSIFTSLFSTKENFQKKDLNSISTTNNQIAGSHKIYSQCLTTSLPA